MPYFDYSKEFIDKNILTDKNIKEKIAKIITLNNELKQNPLDFQIANLLYKQQLALSSYSSNRQEHVVIATQDYFKLFNSKINASDFAKDQIIGLYNTLNKILMGVYENTFSKSLLLNLHYDLMHEQEFGGKFKNNNNFLWNSATREIVFTPPSKYEAPYYIQNICEAFLFQLQQDFSKDPFYYLPMLLMVAVDIVIVHPFDDGNGRTHRLLIDYLLDNFGINIHRYVSLENLVYEDLKPYYDALRSLNANWYEGTDNKNPFINYYLDIIIKAYEVLKNLKSNKIFNSNKNFVFLNYLVENDFARTSITEISKNTGLEVETVKNLAKLYDDNFLITKNDNEVIKFPDFKERNKKQEESKKR